MSSLGCVFDQLPENGSRKWICFSVQCSNSSNVFPTEDQLSPHTLSHTGDTEQGDHFYENF